MDFVVLQRFCNQVLQALNQLLHLARRMDPPVGRPDSLDVPAQPLKNILAQPVPVTRGRAAVIGATVALDSQQVTPRCAWIDNTDVNAVAAASHLGVDRPAQLAQRPDDLDLERAVRLQARGAALAGQRSVPADGEFQIVLEVAYASGAHARQIDLLGHQRAVDDHGFTRSGYRHVQAAMPALTVQRAEVHRDLARDVRPVSDREEDDIALVALHVLQVLDEQLLAGLRRDRAVKLGVGLPACIQQLVDQRLLRLIERDDTQRLCAFARIEIVLLDAADDGIGLRTVGTAAAAVVDPGHSLEPHRDVVRHRRWEGDQRVLVVAIVAEGDEALVAAAVVPFETQLVHARAQAFVENALQVLDALLVVRTRLVRVGRLIEKTGGRQLLGITDNDHLLAPCDDAHRIPHRNLRGFVKDDQIELGKTGVQVLRHGKR